MNLGPSDCESDALTIWPRCLLREGSLREIFDCIEHLFHQIKEDLDSAHAKEIDAFKEALEREKSRVLALEAVQASMQTAHRDIVSRMQENFEQEMEGLRNNVDSAHGEQVQELQSLLEDRHKMVSVLY